jgi:hypothetical protein
MNGFCVVDSGNAYTVLPMRKKTLMNKTLKVLNDNV